MGTHCPGADLDSAGPMWLCFSCPSSVSPLNHGKALLCNRSSAPPPLALAPPHAIGYRNVSIHALKRGDCQPRGKYGATEGGPCLFKDPEREQNGKKADTWVPDHLEGGLWCTGSPISPLVPSRMSIIMELYGNDFKSLRQKA